MDVYSIIRANKWYVTGMLWVPPSTSYLQQFYFHHLLRLLCLIPPTHPGLRRIHQARQSLQWAIIMVLTKVYWSEPHLHLATMHIYIYIHTNEITGLFLDIGEKSRSCHRMGSKNYEINMRYTKSIKWKTWPVLTGFTFHKLSSFILTNNNILYFT